MNMECLYSILLKVYMTGCVRINVVQYRATGMIVEKTPLSQVHSTMLQKKRQL